MPKPTVTDSGSEPVSEYKRKRATGEIVKSFENVPDKLPQVRSNLSIGEYIRRKNMREGKIR